VADLKAELEARLVESPNDYHCLVLLGELNVRVGLMRQARDLLYHATLLPPPSWEAYQRTLLLLRRAEADTKSFARLHGLRPPAWMRQAAGVAWTALTRRHTSAVEVV
jgi:hypothetical protein